MAKMITIGVLFVGIWQLLTCLLAGTLLLFYGFTFFAASMISLVKEGFGNLGFLGFMIAFWTMAFGAFFLLGVVPAMLLLKYDVIARRLSLWFLVIAAFVPLLIGGFVLSNVLWTSAIVWIVNTACFIILYLARGHFSTQASLSVRQKRVFAAFIGLVLVAGLIYAISLSGGR